jgi:anti-sigma28 factor (negative regulator of flagellin synthesis)
MKLVEAIDSKNFESANGLLAEKFHAIMERKMFEVKKMVAAEMCGQGSGFATTKNQKMVDQGVLEEDEPKVTQGTEQEVSEARVAIIKARIRGGKVQRRKKVSNVPGFTLRGGKLTKMSATERRRRKLGARKAARKTKQKQSQSLRKRKLSLMKRSRLGL